MRVLIGRQRGMTTLGWLFFIFVVGLTSTFLLKVTPFYLDDYAVGRVLSSLNEKPAVDSASVNQVKVWIDKGLQTNLVKLHKKEIKVSRDDGLVFVDISYERRLKFLYNIDLVLTFKHDWNTKSQ